MGIEEPDFTVVSSEKNYQVRQYGPVLVAETKVKASFDKAGNAAFRVLADFIFGKNSNQTEISMTAPVTQENGALSGKQDPGKPEKIEMTAPVTQSETKSQEGEEYVIQFTMPKKYTLQTLPRPLDARVQIRELPARKIAVYSYSGSWSEQRYKSKLKEFLETLDQDQISIKKTPPVFARFNSPFSLWFLRRNEIWIEVN